MRVMVQSFRSCKKSCQAHLQVPFEVEVSLTHNEGKKHTVKGQLVLRGKGNVV